VDVSFKHSTLLWYSNNYVCKKSKADFFRPLKSVWHLAVFVMSSLLWYGNNYGRKKVIVQAHQWQVWKVEERKGPSLRCTPFEIQHCFVGAASLGRKTFRRRTFYRHNSETVDWLTKLFLHFVDIMSVGQMSFDQMMRSRFISLFVGSSANSINVFHRHFGTIS